MSTAVATRPPRISDEFLASHKRARILKALAESILGRGYFKTTVTDVVRQAGVARNTFYECFGSKNLAGHGLIAAVCPSAAERLAKTKLDDSGLGVLAVDLAAPAYTGMTGVAEERQRVANELFLVLSKFDPSTVERAQADDPTRATLPPGRHGLPREFVAENQRTRLLNGFAATVAERGYHRTRVEDVTRRAAVSRRTFWERFADKEAIASVFLEWCGQPQTVDPSSGLGAVATEILACGWVDGQLRGEMVAADARSLVAQFAEAAEVRG